MPDRFRLIPVFLFYQKKTLCVSIPHNKVTKVCVGMETEVLLERDRWGDEIVISSMVGFFVSVRSPLSFDLYFKLFAYSSVKSWQEFMTYDKNIV